MFPLLTGFDANPPPASRTPPKEGISLSFPSYGGVPAGRGGSGFLKSARRCGFTLIELLVALTILVTAFSIIWGSFSATVNAWRRGGVMLDELHHGDYVMEQLVSALRSMAFFSSAPDNYGFRLTSHGGGGYPADVLSWVASGEAFMPPESPLQKGLHRISVTVMPDDDGEEAFAIRAYPHLADTAEDEVDPWFVSTEVKGIQCRVYNLEEKDWENEWEDTNSIPSLIEITLYMDPLEEYGDPIKMTRVIEIPVAPAVKDKVTTPGTSAPAEGTENRQTIQEGTGETRREEKSGGTEVGISR